MLSEYIRYASFVSKAYNYAYIATPKAACTYFKTVIAKVEGYSLQNAEDYTIKETRPSQFIHWRKEISIPSLHDVAHILDVTKEHDCFLFAVVRNPFVRLFSAWASKIAEREPNIFDRFHAKAGFPALMPRSERDIPVYFEAFLTYLYEHEYPHFEDDHWNVQARLLRPDQLHYSFIGKTEDIPQVIHRLQKHLQQFSIQVPIIPMINDSLIKYNQHYITDRAHELISIMYKDDFETFGYTTELPKAKKMSNVNFNYLSGVCERNARIGYLYDVANEKQKELATTQSTCDSLHEALQHERDNLNLVLQQLDSSNQKSNRLEALLAETKILLKVKEKELHDANERTEQVTNKLITCKNDVNQKTKSIIDLELSLNKTIGERKHLQAALQDWGIDAESPQGVDGPTIYITTPSLNAVSTIDQTIMSIVTQPGPFRIRYHVQDGGSTDGTVERLQAWQRRLSPPSPLIRCQGIDFSYTCEPDAGLYDAITKAFVKLAPPAEAFIGWLNADDVLLGNALSTISLAQDSTIEWLGGATYVIDEMDRPLLAGVWNYPREVIKAGCCDGNWWVLLQQEGQFFRKRLWDSVGGFNPRLRLAGDWDLWRRFAAFAPFVQIPWPLAAFRKRPGQLSDIFSLEYRNEIETVHPEHVRNTLMWELKSKGFDTLTVQRYRIQQGRAEACLQPCVDFSPLFYSGPEGKTLSEVAAESLQHLNALQASLGISRVETNGSALCAAQALIEDLQQRVDILRATLNEERHAWRSSLLLRMLTPLLPSAVKAHVASGHIDAAEQLAIIPQNVSAIAPGAPTLTLPEAHTLPPYWDEIVGRVSSTLPDLVVVPSVEYALRSGTLPLDRPWVGFLHALPAVPDPWRELLGNAPEELRRLFGDKQWEQAKVYCRGLATFSELAAQTWKDTANVPVRAFPIPVVARTPKWSPDAFRSELHKHLWQFGAGPQRQHILNILRVGDWVRTRICPDNNPNSEYYTRERQLLLERHILFASQLDNIQHLRSRDIPAEILSSGIGIAHYYCSCIPETVLRCLESSAPVLTNPVASVVELLGHEYPLYYNSYPEAEALLENTDRIIAAHEYLLKNSGSLLSLETAVSKIVAAWA